MSNTNYGSLRRPTEHEDDVAFNVERLIQGKINVSGEFWPSNGVEQTVINHPNIGYNSYIAMFPQSARSAAVAEKFSEDRSVRTAKTCTIRHPIFTDGSLFKFMFLVIG